MSKTEPPLKFSGGEGEDECEVLIACRFRAGFQIPNEAFLISLFRFYHFVNYPIVLCFVCRQIKIAISITFNPL